ncbi:hypothetical protein BJ322DRAFT_1107468 [Thelephora terrestris]|uniref:Ribonuclease H1 N-terminal domain-containing protein n=1 Tax=Thelephora terrestris TaxID=56493 RepID=A0A9P6HI59_9AGAM|nr:hypothetical protein BJ322DRAFT_1107468 [Thelephora terrestris]
MAARNRFLFSSPPPTTRPSPIATGTLRSFPITSSPFSSSPPFSFTQPALSSPEPDLFEDFTYSDDMDDDFRRIDTTSAAILNTRIAKEDAQAFPEDRKTWVVFHGREPGVYDDWNSAIFQVQCFSDAFQRAFPSRKVAENAWVAFMKDGTFPDYGRSPWVVYFGRRPGVFERITELECSVKGYAGAIFRSCSSISEGKIKLQLFSERISLLFAGPDPFSGVEDLMPRREEFDNQRVIETAAKSMTPVLAMPNLSLAPGPANPSHAAPNRVGVLPKSTSDEVAESSKSASSRKGPRPGEGWYVAYHAVLPGIYFGVEALKDAKPKPGGFRCALDRESADYLFFELSLDGKVVWAEDE